MKRKFLILIGLATLGYIGFLFNLGGLPFVGADEPRYARIGEEMLLRGDFITPTLEFHPWLEKPPLLYWGEAISYSLFGVSEWSARLPNALLALLTAILTATFVFRIRNYRAAVLAFAVMSTSLLWIVYGRAASTDLPLAATLSIALMSGYFATCSASCRWIVLSAASLGLATLAKGPMAVVIYFIIMVGFALLIQEEFWSPVRLLIGTIVFLSVSAPWYIWVWIENGENFFWTFWVNHNLARFVTDIHHHVQPAWFYLPILLAGVFPWILFLGPSLRRLWKDRFKWNQKSSRVQLFLWLWILLPLTFFSISQAKLPGYILPVVPAAVILASLEWDRILEVQDRRRIKIPVLLTILGSGLISVALVVGLEQNYGRVWPLAGLAVPLLVASMFSFFAWLKSRLSWCFMSLAGGIAVTLFFTLTFAVPISGSYHSPKAIISEAKPFFSDKQPLILYRYFQLTAHYYSGYQTTKGEVYSPENLADYIQKHPQSSYYLLTQDQGLEELKRLYEGEILIQKGNLYLVRIPGSSSQ